MPGKYDMFPNFNSMREKEVFRAAKGNIIRLYIIKLSKWLMLTMPILFLFYRENGLATQDLFILKAVYSFSIVVLEVPSGYLGDVWGRKNSLILGSIMGFAGFAMYCMATSFWTFLICEIILGIGQSFISGSDSALLYDSLQAANNEKDYLKQEGRMISAGNFAEAVAAPLGVLIAMISLRTPFFFQTIVAFAAVPAALTLVEPTRQKMRGHTSFSQILVIVRYTVKDHKGLRAAILFSSLMGTATLTMAWFVQPYFAYLVLPLAWYGILIPLLNLLTGFVSMNAWRVEKGIGRNSIMILIALGIAGGYLLMGFTGSAMGLIFLFAFYGVRGVATPVLRNQINEIIPSDIRATVLSVRNLIIRFAFAILGPVLGWQTDRAGVPSALIHAGLFFLTCGLGAAIYLIRVASAKDTLSSTDLKREASGL
ncbi:MAG: MFS transporter [Desulfobacteraceae bacterium]|nr:MFS transporter [Desulfobacteraceae bacterium]